MGKKTVFISYKNSDGGKPTEDLKIAEALYARFCSLGVKTFYSNVTLIETGSSLYKEAIEQALDEATVLIVVGTKIAYVESRWVRYEWECFHQDILAETKPNGIIIPYLSRNIQRSEKPMSLRNLETFLIEQNPVDELADFVVNYLRAKGLLFEDLSPSVCEAGIDEHSRYRAISAQERRNIEIQSRLTLDMDLPILTRALGQLKTPGRKYVLDVGCAEGVTLKDRLSRIDDPDLCVVGIDRDADVLEMAKMNNEDGRLRFAHIEVDSDEFESNMATYCKSECIPGFDLVTITMLLRHLKAPALAIARLKKFIRPNGCIYVREQDDGSLISYGDKGLIQNIINRHSRITGVSDHYYGRKVFSHLVKAGFCNIQSYSAVRDTAQKTNEEKTAIFHSQFVKRKTYVDYLLSQAPSDMVLRDASDWFGVALDRLHEVFLQPDFYFAETDFAFLALNPQSEVPQANNVKGIG